MTALNVLICEDEYLLAIDLACELGKRGIAVAGIMSSVSETLQSMQRDDFCANAAVLDVQLLDGMAYPLVAPMLARGMAVVFSTGYGQRDLPKEFLGYPNVGKPTNLEQLMIALGCPPSKTSGHRAADLARPA
jgi:ActR/RegA family two-component response regulator